MARFHREQFLNTPADCAWLRETHLKDTTVPTFGSFTLYGNEDAPARLDLFPMSKPEYNTEPCAVVEPGDAGMVVTLATAKKVK